MSTKTYWKSFISEIQMVKYQEMSNIVIHRYITGIYFLQDNTWKENFVFYIKNVYSCLPYTAILSGMVSLDNDTIPKRGSVCELNICNQMT